MVDYRPIWLRGAEVFEFFKDLSTAEEWLTRAVDDHGVVANREADPARDLFRLPHIIQQRVAARTWRARGAAVVWPDFTIDAPAAWRRISAQVPIETSRDRLTSLLRQPSKGKGGRPHAADWDDAIALAIEKEVSERGFPDAGGPAGWQNQADVERWVSILLTDRKQTAGESTIRDHVREILNNIKARN